MMIAVSSIRDGWKLGKIKDGEESWVVGLMENKKIDL
jgi:hypothetical protein